MTLVEAFVECKKRYQDGDQVNCIYSGGINTAIYIVDISDIRLLGKWVVCGDKSKNTPYIVLYNHDTEAFAPIFMGSTDPRITELYKPPKAPHRIEMIKQVVTLVNQLDKYDKIGGIIGSLQKYQKEETLLDQQLRNFKKSTICLE